MRTRVGDATVDRNWFWGSRSHLLTIHTCPLSGLARHTWGAGKEGGPHLQGSIPGSEGDHWSQLQTEKQAAHPHPHPAPTRVELPSRLHAMGTPRRPVLGERLDHQHSPLRAVAARGPAGVGGSPKPEQGQVTSAGLQTKAFLCGNPRRGRRAGGGGRSQPRVGTWPETFYLGAASRGDLRRA